ncbi:MAG: hypothetical protein AAFP84_18690 [Actinomycetota bacterium]
MAADVPQQSAYRLYQGKDVPPQTAFHRDVLAHLLTDDPVSAFETTQHDVIAYLADQHETITSGTPYEMGVVFRELMRLSTNIWVRTAAESPGYRVLLTTAVAVGDGSQADASSLLRSTAVPFTMHRDVHDAVIEMFGLRYTSGHTAERVIEMWGGLVAGNLVSSAINPSSATFYRDTGPDGSPQAWTSVGLLCEALTVRVMEPDPNAARSMSLAPLTEATWVDAPPDDSEAAAPATA